MARGLTQTPAQRARDEGLARARRITWWTAIGAAGVTAIGAAIAANTIPGHALEQQPAATSSAPGGGTSAPAGGTATPPPSDGSGSSPQPPVQNPTTGPVVVSGGS